MQQDTSSAASDRLAGSALVGASLLSSLAMAHHPTGTGHPVLAEIVHAAMIVFVLGSFVGYARLSARRGLHRFSILAALIVYAFGAAANVLAALINGFVIADLVASGLPYETVRFAFALNQALAYGAVYASSFAFLMWGGDLLRDRGWRRIAGVGGVLAAIVPAAFLASGALRMNVPGALVIYLLQAVFGILAGLVLMQRWTRDD